MRGMQPVKLYKHATQMRYNTGKVGLDKYTELGLQVQCSSWLNFETKYVLSLLKYNINEYLESIN